MVIALDFGMIGREGSLVVYLGASPLDHQLSFKKGTREKDNDEGEPVRLKREGT